MTRRTLLATTTAPLLRAQRQRRPNLLFILADTWRGVTLPSIDSNLKATNLARLAREGTDCRRTYTSYAVCCPSRAAILTGRFPRAAGVTRNHSLLPLAQPTMSAALKQVGYRTGYIGKWHLDGGESPGFVPLERRRGFDYWLRPTSSTNTMARSTFATRRRRSRRPGSSPIIRRTWRGNSSASRAASRSTYMSRTSPHTRRTRRRRVTPRTTQRHCVCATTFRSPPRQRRVRISRDIMGFVRQSMNVSAVSSQRWMNAV
jgi:arylsulfatase A-like enzyme